jgi:Cytochrome C'
MTRTLLRAAVPFTVLTLVLSLAAGFAAAGEPTTPLGKWMKPNMGAPMAGQDFATLQKSLDLVASKPPPSGDYANWASIAKSGSAAAAKQDVAGVKASCKQCHDAYKESYKKDFAARPFP